MRIDRLLVERGLVPNRELARRLVMAGEVLVGDRPVTKPGAEVADDAALRLRTPASPYASRGGEKLAGAGEGLLRRLTTYGRHLGLAFQIADDILDDLGGEEADGQTDKELGKVTYPGALGMAGAVRAARRERDAARAAIRPLGRAADPLRGIVDFVVARAEQAGEGDGSPRRAAGG